MEKLAGKLKERLGIGKVDCNQHYNLCYQAKLNGFPTLYFYPGGTGQPQVIYKMLTSLSQIFIMLVHQPRLGGGLFLSTTALASRTSIFIHDGFNI